MQRIPLLLLLLCLAGTSPAAAQLQVRGIRDLQFGSVVAGIPNAAPPADPLRSGEFEVQAKNNAYLLIIFTLPSQLDGPAGAAMPISFSSGDAVWIGKKKAAGSCASASATASVTVEIGELTDIGSKW
jgi:hypothetical protein